MKKSVRKAALSFMATTGIVLVTSGCAPKVKDLDANRIHVGLTKLTYDGTVYACHEMRQGEELSLMCRKAQNRSRSE